MANPSVYFAGPISILLSNACVFNITPPTFSGISSVTPNTDGSITVNWSLASDSSTPVEYLVYIALGSVSAATLFQSSNLVRINPAGTTTTRIFLLGDQSTYLVNGSTYTLGVRAKDAVGNINTNNAILTATAIASGNLPSVYQSVATQLQNTETAFAATEVLLAQDHVNFQADHTNFQSDHANFQTDHSNLSSDHIALAADLVVFSGYLSTFNGYLSTFNSYNTTLGTNVTTFSSDLVTLANDLSTLATELSTFSTQNGLLTTQVGILAGLVSALQVAVGSAAGLGGLEIEVENDSTLELEIIDEEEVT